MLSIYIYFIVYLILVLFFWSLCAINKESLERFARRLKGTAVKQDVSVEWPANARCQAYTIQSLYSHEFIVPEISHTNYTFRTPLPSFEEKGGNFIVCHDINSQTSYIDQIDAIRHGHITSLHETWQLPFPRMKRLSVNGKSL